MQQVSGGLRRVPPLARVAAVVAALLALTALLLPYALAAPPPAAGPDLPWWLLTVLFALVEVHVLHVQVRREAQTVSLCELPLVLGLFFSEPAELLLARLVGPLVVFLLVRKQPLVKVAFNVALLSANVSAAMVVFSLLHLGPITSTWTPPGPPATPQSLRRVCWTPWRPPSPSLPSRAGCTAVTSCANRSSRRLGPWGWRRSRWSPYTP